MNWSVNFDKDIMRGEKLKKLLKAIPWLKKIKREPYPGTCLSSDERCQACGGFKDADSSCVCGEEVES